MIVQKFFRGSTARTVGARLLNGRGSINARMDMLRTQQGLGAMPLFPQPLRFNFASSIPEALETRRASASTHSTAEVMESFLLPGEEAVLKVPPNINAYQLAKLLHEEPQEIVKIIQEQTSEIITDEFQILSNEAIELVCIELEQEIEFVEMNDDYYQKNYRKRAPVVTIMGHVDHGKTTLLDQFRQSKGKTLAEQEFGLITQTIGAFTIRTRSKKEITFIDTPGHEAFQNLRARGAKVTDMIILVISAVESVQKQTIEVIELARQLHIPTIVAINKIDRAEADVESVFLDLENAGIVIEDLGGDVACVPISAKEHVNINTLEEKIVKLAEKKLNLMEDHKMPAQCIVIESNIDEKSGQTTASVLVKKGCLRVNDTFVCGTDDGKIRFMRDDSQRMVMEAYPGQAVHIGGFKSFPEVGNPLYVVRDSKETNIIVQTLKQRQAQEEALKLMTQGDHSDEIKKSIGKLTRWEKRRIKAGDKTILYQRLGIAEEQDINRLKKRFGVEGKLAEENISEVLEGKSNIGKRKSRRKLLQEQTQKEALVDLIQKRDEEAELLKDMDEEEIQEMEKEKARVRDLFRDDSVGYCPIMIKASQAGALETLLAEAEKIIGNNFKISIVDTGVGPLTEKDLATASQTGAIIFGFDIPVPPGVQSKISSAGVSVHVYKLIYKFQDDLESLVEDHKQEELLARDETANTETQGEGPVKQIFEVTGTTKRGGAKKMIQVLGCYVEDGAFETGHLFRVRRGERYIIDKLKVQSLKKYKTDVDIVEEGLECGVAFQNLKIKLQEGDVLEGYITVEKAALRFDKSPGLKKTF